MRILSHACVAVLAVIAVAMPSLLWAQGPAPSITKEMAAGLQRASLYERIDQAVADHIITDDMAKWGHQVRLDGNDQRHADENAPLPTQPDAERCAEFALALAEVIFVLPSRVKRGIEATQKKP